MFSNRFYKITGIMFYNIKSNVSFKMSLNKTHLPHKGVKVIKYLNKAWGHFRLCVSIFPFRTVSFSSVDHCR